jgi:cell division protease FtsH
LLEKEVIFKEDLEEIFGKRPFDKEEVKVEVSDQTTTNPDLTIN